MARPLRELCSTLRRCVRGRLGWLGGPNRATAHHCSAGTGVIGDLFGSGIRTLLGDQVTGSYMSALPTVRLNSAIKKADSCHFQETASVAFVFSWLLTCQQSRQSMRGRAPVEALGRWLAGQSAVGALLKQKSDSLNCKMNWSSSSTSVQPTLSSRSCRAQGSLSHFSRVCDPVRDRMRLAGIEETVGLSRFYERTTDGVRALQREGHPFAS